MRAYGVLFMSVCMVLLLSACSEDKVATENELSDYRPMIYVQDKLFGETADVISNLPEKAVSVGTIEKVVPQNEPMERTNFTSNLLQIGSEIYCDEADPSVVYVKLPDVRYSVYSTIE